LSVKFKGKIASLLLLTGAFIPPGPARASDTHVIPGRSREDGQPRSIPVRIFRNFLVVAQGKLGSSPEIQNFLLDTGTAPSIINGRLARQIGLESLPSTFRALGKTVPAQASNLPEVDLGPIRVVSLPVQVQDLSRLERYLGIPIAGILGMDVLSKSSFRLDYEKRELQFGGVSHLGIPVPYDAQSGIAVAEVRIEGQHERFLVDTASDAIVLFGGNFAEARRLALRSTRQWGASLGDQKMKVQVFPAADILLGGQHFTDDRAYFLPGNADPIFDGLLGVRALGFRALSYDQGRATIYLQR
jgi:predicted aspartyl protease